MRGLTLEEIGRMAGVSRSTVSRVVNERADVCPAAEDRVLDMRRLLPLGPDAVFCASDTMAVGALRALESARVRCPEDVALVGFDGMVEANEKVPSLTTMAQPTSQTGEEAVHLMLSLFDCTVDRESRWILPTRLIIRSSCGCGESRT